MNKPIRFSLFRLVARDLHTRPHRTIAVIIVFSAIAAILFSAQYLAAGASESLDRSTGWLNADLIILPDTEVSTLNGNLLTNRPSSFFLDETMYERIANSPGISRVSPQILVASLPGEACCSGYLQIIGIDPATDFSLRPWLDESYGSSMGPDSAIVGNLVDTSAGSDLLLYGHTFHVTGKLGPTGMWGIDNAVFIRSDDAFTMADESPQKAVRPLVLPRGGVSQVLVQLDPGSSPSETSRILQQNIPGIRIISPVSISSTVAGRLSGILQMLTRSALAATAVFLPLLVILSIMITREMKREVTILGILGATKAFVLRLILAESFSLPMIGGIVGIGGAAIILLGFQNFIATTLDIPFSIPSVQVTVFAAGSALLVMLLLSTVASLYPTIRILNSGLP